MQLDAVADLVGGLGERLPVFLLLTDVEKVLEAKSTEGRQLTARRCAIRLSEQFPVAKPSNVSKGKYVPGEPINEMPPLGLSAKLTRGQSLSVANKWVRLCIPKEVTIL